MFPFALPAFPLSSHLQPCLGRSLYPPSAAKRTPGASAVRGLQGTAGGRCHTVPSSASHSTITSLHQAWRPSRCSHIPARFSWEIRPAQPHPQFLSFVRSQTNCCCAVGLLPCPELPYPGAELSRQPFAHLLPLFLFNASVPSKRKRNLQRQALCLQMPGESKNCISPVSCGGSSSCCLLAQGHSSHSWRSLNCPSPAVRGTRWA